MQLWASPGNQKSLPIHQKVSSLRQMPHHSMPSHRRENSLIWCTRKQCHIFDLSTKTFPKAFAQHPFPRDTSSGMVSCCTRRQARLRKPQPVAASCCWPSHSLCLIQKSNYITFKSPNLVLFLLCTSLLQPWSIFPSLLPGSKPQLRCRICSHAAKAKLFPAATHEPAVLVRKKSQGRGGEWV